MSDLSSLAKLKALAFDVFGSVVDWRGNITREALQVGAALNIERDWALFADASHDGYAPAMGKVRKGELPWTNIDSLHRLIIDSIIEPFGLAGLDEAQSEHLNRAWHRLQPWADSVEGLPRLKRRLTIIQRQLLPADQYGQAGRTILGLRDIHRTVRQLQTRPGDRSANAGRPHPSDLPACAQGCRTAYVIRPLEFGGDTSPYRIDADEFDLVAEDFNDLAAQPGL